MSPEFIHTFWHVAFPTACKDVLHAPEQLDLGCGDWISIYARLSILKAAYYTIMMRAASEIGPGLTEESSIEPALAYMA